MLNLVRNKFVILGLVVAFSAATIFAQTDSMEFMLGHDAAYFQTEYDRSPEVGANFVGMHHIAPSWWHQTGSSYHIYGSHTHHWPSDVHAPTTVTHRTHSGNHVKPSTTHWAGTQLHMKDTTWGQSDVPPKPPIE